MSGLIEKIRASKAKKNQTAREAYLAALRGGRADAIAESAAAAGIGEDQIAADVAILDRAAELGAQASKLPGLKAAAEKTRLAAAVAAKALNDAIAKLQPAANSAAWESQQADAAEREARGTVNILIGLYRDNPDLLSPDDAPAPLKQRWADDAKQAADTQAKRDALRKFADAQRKCEWLEQLLHNMRFGGPLGAPPAGCNGIFDPEQLAKDRPAAIAKGEAALVEARAELAATKTAATTLGLDMTKG